MTTRVGLMIGVHDHGVGGSAILNAAFVPARNAVFLSVAAAHALSWWPDGRVDLVLGACVEDATGFPDCTAQFLAAMTRTLVAGTTREVVIVAPFLDRTKEAMLRDFASDPDAVRDLSESWSCYRGRGPCGTCSACVFRHRAFEAAGFTDCARVLPMIGGDPSRERCS